MFCCWQAGPQHAGRRVELSDTEVDAAAAFPRFRHAVKHTAYRSNESDGSDSDLDVNAHGYDFEGKPQDWKASVRTHRAAKISGTEHWMLLL